MKFNIFTWPPLIAACLNLTLAVIAMVRSPRNPVHRSFAAWNMSMAVWNALIFAYYIVPTATAALRVGLWPRDIVMFIHALFFHFILCFIKDRKALNRYLLIAAYVSGVFFVAANHIPGLLIVGVKQFYYGFYPEVGRVGKFFPILFNLYVWYAVYLLSKTAQKSIGFRRNQCQLLLIGTLLVFGAALTNFLVVLGVHIYPFGNVINIIYSVIIAYAVVTYGLMDIRMFFRRSIVYTGLAAGLSVVYVMIVALIHQMLLRNDSLSFSYAVHIAAVPMTFALAPRMRSWIEPAVRELPFLQTHDQKALQQNFNHTLFGMSSLSILSNFVVTQLQSIFNAESVELYSVDTPTGDLIQRSWIGGKTFERLWPVMHPVVYQMQESNEILLPEQKLWSVEHTEHGSLRYPPELIRFFQTTSLSVIVPIVFQNSLIGLVGLGVKRSGVMYTVEDLRLLESLRTSIAISLSHAQVVLQVQEKQGQIDLHKEMAIVGTMATEIAHELIKPLTHIMNAGSRMEAHLQGAQREHLKTIEKEAQRAAEILDGFSMLSPERELHRIDMPVERLIEEAITLLSIEGDESVRIMRDYEPLPAISVNPGQLVQVFTNLIQNAWQSMPNGGVLTVGIQKARLDHAAVALEITVTDTGLGIAAEIRHKIFEPFFSTKRTQGGRGMGLTISRAMVERHGGQIELESPVDGGLGTRARILLPIIDTKRN